VKELTFTARIPVDWAKAKVLAPESMLQVIDWQVSGDKGICKLKGVAAEEVEAANGVFLLDVPLAEPTPTLASVSARVPVSVRQELLFTVTPKTVLARVDRESGRATARLLVRGKKLGETNQPISEITCPGYRVDWQMMMPSAENTAVVNLQLTPLADKGPGGERRLILRVAGMKPMELPIVNLTAARD